MARPHPSAHKVESGHSNCERDQRVTGVCSLDPEHTGHCKTPAGKTLGSLAALKVAPEKL